MKRDKPYWLSLKGEALISLASTINGPVWQTRIKGIRAPKRMP